MGPMEPIRIESRKRRAALVVCMVDDSPVHVLWEYTTWQKQRREAMESLGYQPDPDSIIGVMLEDSAKWEILYKTITEIIKTKVKEDRIKEERQRTEAAG
ncbi:hypothetical protein WA026_004253 [Henosepilachna vigintioctopunctata]|uniref:Uncharacterized protein n=1 Tax=Henosepilachna vigintioctopunctata TaxID=420089 RepID=A0AAW1V773_9CUCU